MISKSKIESMGLLNWLEKNNLPFIEREDDNYYYVYLQTNCKEIEKLDNCYEYLKKLVLENKSKATEFSILKLISEKLPKFMTKEICLAAVKNDGMYLKDVPQQYLDQEYLKWIAKGQRLDKFLKQQYFYQELFLHLGEQK